jgi:hypothetical protein
LNSRKALDVVIAYAQRWGARVWPKFNRARVARLYEGPGGVSSSIHGPGGWTIADWGTSHPLIFRHGQAHDGWPQLLHELAHVAWPVYPDAIFDESAATTGFEVLSIEYLGLPWDDWETWMMEFSLGDKVGAVFAEFWHYAPAWYRRRIMAKACDNARKIGLFDARSKPTYRLLSARVRR